MTLIRIFMMFALTACLGAGAARADEASDRLFKDVAGDLRCPTCQGLSILDSDASFSVQIKDLVKKKLDEGATRDEVLSFFVDRYGPWILREPPKTGFNLFAWVFPVALMLIGPPLIWFFVWRRRRVVGAQGVRSTEAIMTEMEERLAQLRKGRLASE